MSILSGLSGKTRKKETNTSDQGGSQYSHQISMGTESPTGGAMRTPSRSRSGQASRANESEKPSLARSSGSALSYNPPPGAGMQVSPDSGGIPEAAGASPYQAGAGAPVARPDRPRTFRPEPMGYHAMRQPVGLSMGRGGMMGGRYYGHPSMSGGFEGPPEYGEPGAAVQGVFGGGGFESAPDPRLMAMLAQLQRYGGGGDGGYYGNY